MKFSIKLLSLFLIIGTIAHAADTASILPPAKTTFLDSNGKPLTSGTVDFYIPSTTTRKATWKDAGETILNTNPVVLDAAGRALILGSGSYRQVVKDRNNNIIWDQVTSSAGSGSTTASTGDGDLVGTIKPWAGMTAPNQYAFTYGQEISRTTYSVLLTAITSSQAAFCSSGSPILTGLTDTTNFWIGSAVELSCVAAGFSTIISKTSTTVTLAANSNVTTNITVVFFPWGRGNGVTTFNLPDFRGVPIAGNNNMGGVASSNLTTTYFGATNPNSVGALGGSQSKVLLLTNLPPYTPTGTNSAITVTSTIATILRATVHDNYTSVAGDAGPIQNVTNGIVTSTGSAPSFTGVAQGGASTAFSIVPPIKTSNYIIKIIPDTSSAISTGVTSLGGMTGDIACGQGLSCTGNIISNVNVGLAANLPVIGTGSATPLASGTKTGNTNLFTTGSGSYIPTNCIKSDANGNLVDAAAPCGVGTNVSYAQDFIAGTDFTAGTTTSLTVSNIPLSTQSTSVYFDGVRQSGNTWSLSVATVTFFAAIPLNTLVVEISSLTTTVLPTWVTSINGQHGAIILSYVMPSDYGIVCDGSTDVTALFQTMVNSSTGKVIFIPPGPECVISSTITLPSNTTITGGGREVSSVKGITDAANPIFSSINATKVSLTNFWCQGTDSATTWTVTRSGCYQFIMNSSSIATSSDIIMSGLKLTGFNVNYWVHFDLSSSVFGLNEFTFDDNIVTTATGDIPTDANPLNNRNGLLVMFSGTLGNGRIIDASARNNIINANSSCFGIALFSNYLRPHVIGNRVIQTGQTSPTHCVSGLGTINSYGILIYDANSDHNPPENFIVSDNVVDQPYASGIYIVGDFATVASGKTRSIISNNIVQSQTSNDDTTLPRAGITVNGTGDLLIEGNYVTNGYGGIAVTSQGSGTTSILNNYCYSGTGDVNSYCLRVSASVGITNLTKHIIKSNIFENLSGFNVLIQSSITNQLGDVEISANTIASGTNGLRLSAGYTSGLVTITENKFSGTNSGTMFLVNSLTGLLALKDNIFGTTGSGMTFATLPTAINGSSAFVSDAAPASSPCTGGSTGSTAFRQNGAWKCF